MCNKKILFDFVESWKKTPKNGFLAISQRISVRIIWKWLRLASKTNIKRIETDFENCVSFKSVYSVRDPNIKTKYCQKQTAIDTNSKNVKNKLILTSWMLKIKEIEKNIMGRN